MDQENPVDYSKKNDMSDDCIGYRTPLGNWDFNQNIAVPKRPKQPATIKENARRGRPRLDAITGLILEGSASHSSIKCKMCSRVFPREKSLHVHMRTHTGERPYKCDFPGCQRAFAQSGQLKTHERLHTGEKPFVCSEKECASRFTHANRHCMTHPCIPLERNNMPSSTIVELNCENEDEDVLRWLLKHSKEKNESSKTSPPRKKQKVENNKNIQSFDELKEREMMAYFNLNFENPEHRERISTAGYLVELFFGREFVPQHFFRSISQKSDADV